MGWSASSNYIKAEELLRDQAVEAFELRNVVVAGLPAYDTQGERLDTLDGIPDAEIGNVRFESTELEKYICSHPVYQQRLMAFVAKLRVQNEEHVRREWERNQAATASSAATMLPQLCRPEASGKTAPEPFTPEASQETYISRAEEHAKDCINQGIFDSKDIVKMMSPELTIKLTDTQLGKVLGKAKNQSLKPEACRSRGKRARQPK